MVKDPHGVAMLGTALYRSDVPADWLVQVEGIPGGRVIPLSGNFGVGGN